MTALIRRMGAVPLAALLGATAIHPGTACAQNLTGPPGKTGVYNLGEVVVSGKRENVTAGQTVDGVDARDIENKAARSVDEALQQLPGTNIQLRNQGQPRLDIRGLPPRQVRLFLNGVPINSADDGQFDPSLIPSENIAEIKVIRGTSSVLYGPDALGGIVDIVTRKGTATGASELSAEFGEGNERLETAYHSGAYKQADYFVSGSHFERTGFPVAGDGLRANSDKKRTNFFLNAGFTPNDEWSFGVNFGYLRGQQGIPPSTVNDPKNIFASQPRFERLDDIRGQTAQLDMRYAPSGPFDARFSLYVNNLDEEDNRYDNANFNSMSDPTVKTFHQENDTTVSGGQFQGRYSLGNAGELTLGLLAHRDARALHGSIRDVTVSGGGGGGRGGRGGGGGGGGNTFAFRNLDDTQATHTLTSALEYATSPLDAAHLVLGFAEDLFVRNNHSNAAGSQLVLSGSYDLLKNVTLGAAFSRDIRFPSIQELYDVEQGNADLNPERANNAQASVDWKLPRANTISVTGFRNHVRGFIQNDQVAGHFVNKEAVLRGVELSWRSAPFENLAFRAAYTYLDATDETGGVDNGQLDQRPHHKIDLDANVAIPSGWRARLGVTYLADQTISSKTTPTIRESLANESFVNIRLSKSFFEDKVSFYVGADNLFDTDHNTGPGFPLPGRFVYGGFRIRL